MGNQIESDDRTTKKLMYGCPGTTEGLRAKVA